MNLLITGFFVFLFLFFPRQAFAAFNITNISPMTINSTDDIITISASASALDNKDQYFEIAITKQGATNYFGFTKNQSNSWYKYKSSPTTSDLSSYFYKFTPTNGSWTGTILGKLDTANSGYKGPGTYSLKLLKFISIFPTSSNFVTLTVNVPTLAPSPTLSPSVTSVPTDTVQDSSSPTPTEQSDSMNLPTFAPNPTTISINLFDKASSSSQSVLPVSTKASSLNSTPNSKEEKFLADRKINISKILTGVGVVIILGSVGFFLKSLRK